MTVNSEGFEYNILGSQVRLKKDDEKSNIALRAIEVLQKEIEQIKSSSSNLKDIDIAVLCALKLASEKIEVEDEYKENILSLRGGIVDALDFIEEVSPGTMQS